ncbi:MAG: deoxyguanosinetriphosphate triphosphohydrolase [Candidatus Melainabacteria bacterium]|nr:deoxyguanosinetriphosphate triphosphohydrolase [Candidatus Melainabacteria bacterium]
MHAPKLIPLEAVRLEAEAREDQWLHPLAVRSTQSKGRQKPEVECLIRTCFQRDRDRILHSKAFRRLKHKTQVFTAPVGDHYRTRMTHTLEVSQIARTIARALALNEDLTEAVALAHDLGHPPFAHAGEIALAQKSSFGFCHSEQGLRIVTLLEPLNLCTETLEGIANQKEPLSHTTVEAWVVEIADRMAYLHHDVEDATRSGMMQETDIPKEIRSVLGERNKERLDRLVMDLVAQTRVHLSQGQAKVAMQAEVWEAMMALRQWMHQHVYGAPQQQEKDRRVCWLIEGLYTFFIKHPHRIGLDPHCDPAVIERRVVDYIAGMTDRFALETYERDLLPSPYQGLRQEALIF